ncbi:MAG: AAA family ATPase [Oscillospiraceae bacterium]
MPQRQETQPVMSRGADGAAEAGQVKVADNVRLRLSPDCNDLQQVKLGASPRGSIAMFRAAQAMALMNDRDYATPDDVKAVAIPVLAHRIVLASGQTDYGAPQDIVAELLSNTHIPM